MICIYKNLSFTTNVFFLNIQVIQETANLTEFYKVNSYHLRKCYSFPTEKLLTIFFYDFVQVMVYYKSDRPKAISWLVHWLWRCSPQVWSMGNSDVCFLLLIRLALALKCLLPLAKLFFLKSRPQILAKSSNKIEFEVIADFYDAIENTVFEVKKEH